MKRTNEVIIAVVAAIVVCMIASIVIKYKEPFSTSASIWSNGRNTMETVNLEAYVRSRSPAIWMDGESFHKNVWMDKSGRGNDSINSNNIQLGSQSGAANGCNAAFKYITGKKGDASSLTLGRGWPVNNNYTFFHVTRYDGPNKNRIWTNARGSRSRGTNWLSGHHGGSVGRFYHNRWLTTGRRASKDHKWQITSDRYDNTRSRTDGRWSSSSLSSRYRRYVKPLQHGVAIGTTTAYSREQSDWACAEVLVFARRLSNYDVSRVEEYLQRKYGFT